MEPDTDVKRRVPSIRGALVLTTVVALVPALLIIVVGGLARAQHHVAAFLENADRQIETIAGIQEETQRSARRLLDMVAALPAFRTDNFGHQDEVLAVLLEKNPQLINISVVDRSGHVVASPNLPAGFDLSDRLHIQGALQDGCHCPGEYVLARADGAPAFPYATPIRDDGGVIIGAVGLVHRLSEYAGLFDRLEFPEETILGITDQNGTRIFFHPAKETNPIGVQIKESVWNGINAGEYGGVVRDRGSDGIARFYMYRRLYLPGAERPYLNIVLGFPEGTISADATSALATNAGLMALVLILAVATAVFLGRAVLGRRFEALAATAGRISDGDLSARTGIPPGKAELAQLACAVDEMAERLETESHRKEEEERRMSKALREKELLLQEIHHRVKNNLQLVLSIVHLQQASGSDLDTFCSDLENRIGAIAAVHEMFYESDDLGFVPIDQCLERLAMTVVTPGASDAVEVRADALMFPIEQAVPISLIASELMVNASKYGAGAGAAGSIRVTASRDGDGIVLTIGDSGPGFPAVGDGLSPVTGPVAADHGDGGLGLKLVQAMCEQLGASLDFGRHGELGGALVTVRVPSGYSENVVTAGEPATNST